MIYKITETCEVAGSVSKQNGVVVGGGGFRDRIKGIVIYWKALENNWVDYDLFL